MPYPPEDPSRRALPELPVIRGPREPIGYRPGWQWEERLQGVLLVVVGLLGLAGVYVVSRLGGLPGAPAPPPGLPPLGATSCLLPMIAVGSVGLLLVGVRRIVDP